MTTSDASSGGGTAGGGAAGDDGTDDRGGAARDERVEQLTTAPKADASDAAPRIDVTETESGTKRIDVRDDAKYRPGKS